MAAHPHPAIVVAAWNRPQSLQRLLDSLAAAHFSEKVTLHISIDQHKRADVIEVAKAFQWNHGEKVIEQHPEKLGLRQHILHCGGLTRTYGAIILLEDDLLVAPFMYAYACEALAFMQDEPAVAGISLYHYQVAESCHQPFEAWQDGSDNYFLQLPSSWGAAFSAAQWEAFVAWMTENHARLPQLPSYIQAWSKQSWKKLFAAYLIGTDKYFSYPKQALSTNTEDFGVHANTAGLFQVPLLMGEKAWKLTRPSDCILRYDAWFEPNAAFLKSIQPALANYDFEVDLFGQKEAGERGKSDLLTAQKGGNAKLGFAKAGFSNIAAIWAGREGSDFRLLPANTALEKLALQDFEFGFYAGAAKSALLHLPEVRMPSYSVIYIAGEGENKALDSFSALLDQAYAGLEIIALVPETACPDQIWAAHCAGRIRLLEYAPKKTWEAIQKAVAAATGPLVHVLEAGAVLMPDVIEKIAKIFRQFPDLEWLSALPQHAEGKALSKLISFYRWDSDRFGNSVIKTESSAARAEKIEGEIRAWLPISLQIFRRDLWMRAPQAATNIYGHLRAIGGQTLPKVAAFQMAQGKILENEGLPEKRGLGKVNKTRAYYHRHIPLLWKLHRKWSDYAPVLRYDQAHQTWYEFDY